MAYTQSNAAAVVAAPPVASAAPLPPTAASAIGAATAAVPSSHKATELVGGRYQIIETVGQGTYGRVYKVRNVSDGSVVILKQIPFAGTSEREKLEIANEVDVMTQIDHRSFIRFVESFVEAGLLNIVMELAKGGDLSRTIKMQQKIKAFDEDQVWTYLIQLCQGLKYLHDKRILHRDIKPQNIFLDSVGDVKIGDLGLGRILGSKSLYAQTGVGTPLYFSPELCEDKPYDDKSDIWALGCVLYEVMTFAPPFLATNQIALAKKIVAEKPAPLPDHYSTELKFLVMKMLEKDTKRRPDITQILNYSPIRLRLDELRLKEKELQLDQKYRELEHSLQSKLNENHDQFTRFQLAMREQNRRIVMEYQHKLDACELDRCELASMNSQLIEQIEFVMKNGTLKPDARSVLIEMKIARKRFDTSPPNQISQLTAAAAADLSAAALPIEAVAIEAAEFGPPSARGPSPVPPPVSVPVIVHSRNSSIDIDAAGREVAALTARNETGSGSGGSGSGGSGSGSGDDDASANGAIAVTRSGGRSQSMSHRRSHEPRALRIAADAARAAATNPSAQPLEVKTVAASGTGATEASVDLLSIEHLAASDKENHNSMPVSFFDMKRSHTHFVQQHKKLTALTAATQSPLIGAAPTAVGVAPTPNPSPALFFSNKSTAAAATAVPGRALPAPADTRTRSVSPANHTARPPLQTLSSSPARPVVVLDDSDSAVRSLPQFASGDGSGNSDSGYVTHTFDDDQTRDETGADDNAAPSRTVASAPTPSVTPAAAPAPKQVASAASSAIIPMAGQRNRRAAHRPLNAGPSAATFQSPPLIRRVPYSEINNVSPIVLTAAAAAAPPSTTATATPPVNSEAVPAPVTAPAIGVSHTSPPVAALPPRTEPAADRKAAAAAANQRKPQRRLSFSADAASPDTVPNPPRQPAAVASAAQRVVAFAVSSPPASPPMIGVDGSSGEAIFPSPKPNGVTSVLARPPAFVPPSPVSSFPTQPTRTQPPVSDLAPRALPTPEPGAAPAVAATTSAPAVPPPAPLPVAAVFGDSSDDEHHFDREPSHASVQAQQMAHAVLATPLKSGAGASVPPLVGSVSPVRTASASSGSTAAVSASAAATLSTPPPLPVAGRTGVLVSPLLSPLSPASAAIGNRLDLLKGKLKSRGSPPSPLAPGASAELPPTPPPPAATASAAAVVPSVPAANGEIMLPALPRMTADEFGLCSKDAGKSTSYCAVYTWCRMASQSGATQRTSRVGGAASPSPHTAKWMLTADRSSQWEQKQSHALHSSSDSSVNDAPATSGGSSGGGGSNSLIVVYTVQAPASQPLGRWSAVPGIRTFKVRFVGDTVFHRIAVPAPVIFKPHHYRKHSAAGQRVQRALFDVTSAATDGRAIAEFSLEFDLPPPPFSSPLLSTAASVSATGATTALATSGVTTPISPSPIEQVVVLQYDQSFLSLAALPAADREARLLSRSSATAAGGSSTARTSPIRSGATAARATATATSLRSSLSHTPKQQPVNGSASASANRRSSLPGTGSGAAASFAAPPKSATKTGPNAAAAGGSAVRPSTQRSAAAATAAAATTTRRPQSAVAPHRQSVSAVTAAASAVVRTIGPPIRVWCDDANSSGSSSGEADPYEPGGSPAAPPAAAATIVARVVSSPDKENKSNAQVNSRSAAARNNSPPKPKPTAASVAVAAALQPHRLSFDESGPAATDSVSAFQAVAARIVDEDAAARKRQQQQQQQSTAAVTRPAVPSTPPTAVVSGAATAWVPGPLTPAQLGQLYAAEAKFFIQNARS